MATWWKGIAPWLETHGTRIGFLLTVIAIAVVISVITRKAMHRLLHRSTIPNASIFINILLTIIWVIAFISVLKPVFGIDPTTLWTALGIGGLAVSFGLKDTIANVFGGFGLMAGKVVQPGDIITIQGVTGTVLDVTWRHTVVAERNGAQLWVPNSVLNTVALEKIEPHWESLVTIPLVIAADADLDSATQQITALVARATEQLTDGEQPELRLQGFSINGIQAEVWVHARYGVLASTVQDAGSRSLAGQPFIKTL